MTALATIGVVATLFTSLYPRVMVSSTDFANSLTVDSAASSHYALQVMAVVALVFVPLVLLYQGWAYYAALLPTNEDRAKALVDWAGSGLTHTCAGRFTVDLDED